MAIDAKTVTYLQVRVDSSQIPQLNQRLAATQAQTSSLQRKFRAFGNTTRQLSRTMFTFVSLPIAAVFAGAAYAAGSFEEAMIEVQKVTDEVTANKLSQEIREMAETIPLAHNELADLTAQAARFGIEGEENITSFVESVAKIAIATDITADEAGKSFAKLATVTNLPISQIENLGSAVNGLSNTYAASASEIVTTMSQAGAAASNFGLNVKEIAGISVALNEVSVSARRAGTRLRRVFQELRNPKKIGKFASALGLTAQQFEALRQSNPQQLFVRLVETMGETSAAADTLRTTFSSASRTALENLGQNIEGLNTGLTEAERLFGENTSLAKEYEDAVSTLFSQFKLLKNEFVEIGITLGNELMPTLRSFVGSLKDATDWFQSLSDSTKNLIVQFGLWALAINGVIAVVGLLFRPLTKLIGLITTLAGAGVIGALSSAVNSLKIAFVILVQRGIAPAIASLSGLSAAIAATGIGALVVLIGAMGVKAYNTYQEMQRLREVIENIDDLSLKQVNSEIDNLQNKLDPTAWEQFWDGLLSIIPPFLRDTSQMESTLDRLIKKKDELINNPVGVLRSPQMDMASLGLLPGQIISGPQPPPLILPIKVVPEGGDSRGGGNVLSKQIRDIVSDIQNQLQQVALKAGLGSELQDILLPDFNEFKARLEVLKSGMIDLLEEGVRPGTKLWNSWKNKVLEARDAQKEFNQEQAISNLRVSSLPDTPLGAPIDPGALQRALSPRQQQLKASIERLEYLKGLIPALGWDAVADDIRQVQKEIDTLNSGVDDTTKHTKGLTDVMGKLGFTMQSAFSQAIVEGNSLRDVMIGLLKDIEKVFLRLAINQSWDLSGIGKFLNVSDALITSDGDIIQGHPNDNWLAFQGDPDRLGGGGGEVTVNVINNNGSEVQTTQRKKAGGGVEIGVMIDNKVRESMNNGSYDNNLRQSLQRINGGGF